MVRRELMGAVEMSRQEAARQGEVMYAKPEAAAAFKAFFADPTQENAIRLLEEAPPCRRYFEACCPGGLFSFYKDLGIDQKPHLRFIGEDGFYPAWVMRDGRWVFQRTLITVGASMSGVAEMAAERVLGSDQVIVWVPPLGKPRGRQEELEALRQLAMMRLRCYGEDCNLSSTPVTKCVGQTGGGPEGWRLSCPHCAEVVGPDLEPVIAERIVARWEEAGRPALEDSGACSLFASTPAINDLRAWLAKNDDPSNLELAYLGQQMWPDIVSMLRSLDEPA